MILPLDEDVGWFSSASAKAAVGVPLFSNPAYTATVRCKKMAFP